MKKITQEAACDLLLHSDAKYISQEQPAKELFELFAVRIRLSTLACKEIIENIIYLQGYMYILQGDTCDMVRQKLLLFVKDIQ